MDNSSDKEKLTMDKIRVKTTLTTPLRRQHMTYISYTMSCVFNQNKVIYISITPQNRSNNTRTGGSNNGQNPVFIGENGAMLR